MVILIVDSSQLILERLADILSETAKKKMVYLANTYAAAANLVKTIQPDIILLDIYLTENKSIALLKEIKSDNKDTKVIMLTNDIDFVNEKRYWLAGADYILDKYNEFEKIPAAIDMIGIENKIKQVQEKTV